MTENVPSPSPPTGYDTVLQVLADMRREQIDRDLAQAERDIETHRLLEALIGAIEAHDATLRELVSAARPPKDGGKSLRDTLKELFGGIEARLDGLGEKVDALPEEVAGEVGKLVEVETVEATPSGG
ncbi:hypothetical protein [Paracraurococcus lichenis]|uniref:Uncharacterized protein n=1 Tax=Paracraurococcus lichenis TaxID=3064888 RepID=A0ABT9E9R3_9PROT|nr:hypothetical protein [Paracraurococcus sp. LOR1-02]MDO9712805.1 hypothetical protein [Paracraurococcus sp. LOR1-02]